MPLLYVEWGFAYPKPAEFAALYDERAVVRNDEGKIEAVPQILLVRAGKRAGNLRTTGKAALHNARWLRVALPSHTLTEDLYDLTLPKEIEFAQIHAGALEEKKRLGARLEASLHTRLEAGELRNVIGATDEIERRIAQCSSELEDLLTRKARLATRRHSTWLPAYTFDQRDGEPLPEKLRLFLRRPLGEIAQYRYTALRGPAGLRHCLVGDVAIPWGAALAVPSDGTWLCDARWREWSLPLFLRSDCALTVHVDEENMAGRVRDLLLNYQELDLGNTDSVILTEPSDTKGGLTFCPLAPVQTLDTAIAFFNDEMGCRKLAAESFARASTDLVSDQDAAVSDEVRRLDASLQQRAAEILGELEQGWAATRERAMGTLLRLRVTEAAMEIGEAACVQSAQSWAEFVNHVLELDDRISKVKLEAAARWFQDEADRQRRLDAVVRAQKDFTAELLQSKAKHEAAKKLMEEEQRQIEAALKELDSARAATVAEEVVVSRKAGEIQAQNKLAEVELKNAQAALAKLEQTLEQAARLRQQLDQTQTETANKSQQLNERRAEIGRLEQELAQQTAEARRTEENIQEALGPLRHRAEEALSFVRAHLTPPPEKPSFGRRLAGFFGFGKKKRRG